MPLDVKHGAVREVDSEAFVIGLRDARHAPLREPFREGIGVQWAKALLKRNGGRGAAGLGGTPGTWSTVSFPRIPTHVITDCCAGRLLAL